MHHHRPGFLKFIFGRADFITAVRHKNLVAEKSFSCKTCGEALHIRQNSKRMYMTYCCIADFIIPIAGCFFFSYVSVLSPTILEEIGLLLGAYAALMLLTDVVFYRLIRFEE